MTASQQSYDRSFMRLAAQAQKSAELVIGLLRQALHVESVADFGCALGTWLSVWQSAGVNDIAGIDGDYVREEDLLIPRDHFRAHDLSRPIDLQRRFDLAESMEVAEHLPHAAADTFVASLVRHSDMVLFSAAPPGQGGEHHINEQPFEYWQERFARHDYRMFDWIRPQIIDFADIQFWYRYNLFLFVGGAALANLPTAIRQSEVKLGQAIRDLSPWTFKLRKQMVSRLPLEMQTRLSRMMSRLRYPP